MSDLEFEAEVIDISHLGLGVVKRDDEKTFFVPGVWPGDAGRFLATKEKKTYGFAELLELTKESEERREEFPCKYQGFSSRHCGGCDWMPLSYEAQLKYKNLLVRRALIETDLAAADVLNDIAPSPEELGYRNRAQLKTDGNRLGFIASKTKELIDIKECAVLNEACNEQLTNLRSKLPNPKWNPSGKFLWNLFEINDQEINVEPNKRLPFMQGNHAQNLEIKKWLRQKLKSLPKQKSCIELFCGSGNLSLEVANSNIFETICCVEVDDSAIKALRGIKIPNLEARAANLYNPKIWPSLKINPETSTLILDPPREGFEPISDFVKCLPALNTVIYISCDLQSLKRDLKEIKIQGFEIEEIQPFDMFPQTPHVETAILATKKK